MYQFGMCYHSCIQVLAKYLLCLKLFNCGITPGFCVSHSWPVFQGNEEQIAAEACWEVNRFDPPGAHMYLYSLFPTPELSSWFYYQCNVPYLNIFTFWLCISHVISFLRSPDIYLFSLLHLFHDLLIKLFQSSNHLPGSSDSSDIKQDIGDIGDVTSCV